MIRRHYLLLLAMLGAAHLTGCKASQPAAERAEPSVATDTTTALIQPRRTALDKLLNRPTAGAFRAPVKGLQVGKKSTLIINHGHGNTTSVTGNKGNSATGAGAINAPVEKAKAPVATGTGAKATDQRDAGTAANIEGDGNRLEQTNTKVKPLGLAGILKRVALVAAIGAGLYFFWPVLWPLLLGLFRRKNT